MFIGICSRSQVSVYRTIGPLVFQDFWEMFIHHIATISLLSFSWVINFVRVGTLVLCIHDSVDFWIEVSFQQWCLCNLSVTIRKTCPCNIYPLKPHFYIAKLGYAGVYIFFLFLLQNIDCGHSCTHNLCFEQK